MKRSDIILYVVCTVAVVLLFSGCTTRLRNKQLENVAKDWSYVVRASQVIPVYPLTEDLQPGDLMLVSTPIDEQQKIYEKKGFLPLDQLLVRLNPKDYPSFYGSRYGISRDGKIPPGNWQEMITDNGVRKQQWDLAPNAAFPTYDFEVSTGAGLNLAIPVQGIPIALGLMKSGKGKGSIAIGKSYTFGLDNVTLKKNVDEWASENRGLLLWYRPVEKDGRKMLHFLRVVSRVYAISDINVTIQNDEAFSGDLRGGADKTVDLPELKDKSSAENYKEALKIFNDALNDQLPGGKVRVVAASSRSVTLRETFEHPLVMGYVGFDMPILEGGRLGAPISTLTQLTGIPVVRTEDANNIYRLAALTHMYSALNEIHTPRAREINDNLDKLGEMLPETYPFSLYEFSSPSDIRKDRNIISGGKIIKRDFNGVLDYLGNGNKTISTLQRYLAQPNPSSAMERSVMETELREAREAIDKINQDFSGRPELAEAVDFVFFGN